MEIYKSILFNELTRKFVTKSRNKVIKLQSPKFSVDVFNKCHKSHEIKDNY